MSQKRKVDEIEEDVMQMLVDHLSKKLKGEEMEFLDVPDDWLPIEFIKECREEFGKNPTDKLARNAVINSGMYEAETDPNAAAKVTHDFMISLKKKHQKTTDQGNSGRCWLFAALNTFRHFIIKALDLENFEFSQIYLYFWDKFERSNVFLQHFIDHPEYDPHDRLNEYILDTDGGTLCDGGYWNYFASLVMRYGLIPKTAMAESAHSQYDSEGINSTLKDYLTTFAIDIQKKAKMGMDREELIELKKEYLRRIYGILVKFLGEPPTKFDWWFHTEEDDTSHVMRNQTPATFMNAMLPDPSGEGSINLFDYISLVHIPVKDKPYEKLYEMEHSNNMLGGQSYRFLNLPINELKKYAVKSIEKNIPVWFACTVSRGFSPRESAFDEKIITPEVIFGEKPDMDKGERVNYHNSDGGHAMVFTGLNPSKTGHGTDRWQVENSWGYIDSESSSLDGFWSMDDKWFDENVFEVVVHKNFLSRTILKMLDQEPILIKPWNGTAPAMIKRSVHLDKLRSDWRANIKK